MPINIQFVYRGKEVVVDEERHAITDAVVAACEAVDAIEAHKEDGKPRQDGAAGARGSRDADSRFSLPPGTMSRYRSHKVVHAAPMMASEYLAFTRHKLTFEDRHATIAENGDTPGYLVVYQLGTSDEYISWSPKQAFDDGYTAI